MSLNHTFLYMCISGLGDLTVRHAFSTHWSFNCSGNLLSSGTGWQAVISSSHSEHIYYGMIKEFPKGKHSEKTSLYYFSKIKNTYMHTIYTILYIYTLKWVYVYTYCVKFLFPSLLNKCGPKDTYNNEKKTQPLLPSWAISSTPSLPKLFNFKGYFKFIDHKYLCL